MRASAFDGDEHRAVSNLALRVALEVQPTSGGMRTAADDQLAMSITFGDLTAEVDHFQSHVVLTDPILAADRIARRNRGLAFFWRGLSAHNNIDHFQSDAMAAYSAFHDCALEEAAAGEPTAALQNEAVALHFLEDSLAAGHIATARRHSHDVAAGSMHDQYNDDGVIAELTSFVDRRGGPPWRALRDAMTSVSHNCGRVRPTRVDLDAFDTAVSDVEERSFYGDGHLLNDGTKCPRPGEQVIAIVLLAAESVREVLAAAAGQSSVVLRGRFIPRSYDPAQPRSVRYESAQAEYYALPARLSWPLVISQRASIEPRARILAYRVPSIRDDLGINSVSGVAVQYRAGWSASGGERVDIIDVGKVISASDPRGSVRRRDECGVSDEDFSEGPIDFWTIHIMEMPQGGAAGLRGGVEMGYVVGPVTIGLVPMLSRYRELDTHRYRWEWAARLGFGIQVFNFELGIERVHGLDANRRLAPRNVVTFGPTLTLSTSWVKDGVLHPIGRFFSRNSKNPCRPRSDRRSPEPCLP